jgi:hypothetical protein
VGPPATAWSGPAVDGRGEATRLTADGADLRRSGSEADEPQTRRGLTGGGAERTPPAVEDAEVADEGRQPRAVPGGGDDGVDVGPVAVGEARSALLERGDARDDLEAAGPDGGQDVPVDDGGAVTGAGQSLERALGRRGEPVTSEVAEDETPQQRHRGV